MRHCPPVSAPQVHPNQNRPGRDGCKFHDKDVKALNVIEFLVADAIRDTITPLSATLDDHFQIVDVSISYVHPEGREVTVKALNDHQCAREKVTFAISAEGLPPRIEVDSGASVSL